MSKIHRLRNLLTVIIGGIETNNTELAMRAIRSMQQELEGCRSCTIASDQPMTIQNSAFSTVEVSVAEHSFTATQDVTSLATELAPSESVADAADCLHR